MAKRKIRTAEEFLAQDPRERRAETMRLLAERIVHHERRAEEERRERDRHARRES
jgi:hypothetical protein